MKRRVPSPAYLKQILRLAPFHLDPVERRLAMVHTIDDLRSVARRRTPQGPFDYVDGNADEEISGERIRRAYRGVTFHPEALADVSEMTLSTSLLGKTYDLPFGFGPTGFTRMMHAAGEQAVWRAASKAGIPYSLSSFGTTRYDGLANKADVSVPWFQLYLLKDFQRTLAILEELRGSGCDTLVITIDTAVPGRRLRDLYNGMTFPPQLTAKTFLNASIRPEWWINLLTTEPLSFAYGDGTLDRKALTGMIDPSVTWADISKLRDAWPGKLIIKGVQTSSDARLAVEAGVDAIVLSNHGGRQLDRTMPPVRLLPEVAQELQGGLPILVDSGVRSGSDIVTALALGADFVLLGRAYLYGLMAAGERGVSKSIEILESETRRTMALLGVAAVSELNGAHVTLGDAEV